MQYTAMQETYVCQQYWSCAYVSLWKPSPLLYIHHVFFVNYSINCLWHTLGRPSIYGSIMSNDMPEPCQFLPLGGSKQMFQDPTKEVTVLHSADCLHWFPSCMCSCWWHASEWGCVTHCLWLHISSQIVSFDNGKLIDIVSSIHNFTLHVNHTLIRQIRFYKYIQRDIIKTD